MKTKTPLYITIAIILLFSSCGVSKEKLETDKSISTKQTESKVIYRPSDTVVSETKYNVKYKDTTIVSTNYETKTVLREIYDSYGNRRAECIPEEIREEIQTIKEEIRNDIESIKNTEHNFDPTPFIWALFGLGVIILLIGIGMMHMISSLKKSLPGIVKSIVQNQV